MPSRAAVQVDYNKPPGFDRARNREVGKKDITLETLEEAFTSEHWIVRIYKASVVFCLFKRRILPVSYYYYYYFLSKGRSPRIQLGWVSCSLFPTWKYIKSILTHKKPVLCGKKWPKCHF